MEEITKLNEFLEKMRCLMNHRTYEVFLKAQKHCTDILNKTSIVVNDFLRKKGIREDDVCFVAVGSVGRLEALQASDLDFIPLLKNNNT